MKGYYLMGCIETKENRFLRSISALKNAVLNICSATGLNVVSDNYHIFHTSNGITYCFIISQSHFVIHTWPETNKIYFDIFTCNKKLNVKKLSVLLSKEFNGMITEIKKIDIQ